MNILLLTTSYFPEYNGASLRVEGLCKGLTQLGHRVIVMAPGTTRSKENHPYCTVYRIPFKNRISSAIEHFTKFHLSRYLAYSRAIPDIVNKEHITLIHTRQPLDLFAAGLLAKKKLGLRWITEAHKFLSITDYENKTMSLFRKNIILRLEKKLINKSDGVVALSASGVKRLNHLGITPPKIAIENAPHHQKKKSSISHKEQRLIYAGTLRDVEGLDILLKAFLEIHTHCPHATLYLVGGGKNDDLATFVKKHNLQSSVTFTGEVHTEQMFRYLCSSYLFVYPRKNVTYHHDIIGLKIYDAISAQLPIVTADIGELGRLITSSSLGMVTKPNDPHDFALKVIHLLNNKKHYTLLKKNLANYHTSHTWKKNCAPLEQLYMTITTTNKRTFK